MLTVFITANKSSADEAKALTRTLNALVSATVDGLVREVVVLAESSDEVAAKLADHSGCDLASETDFPARVIAAKGEYLLLLEGGALPEHGWAEAIGNHIQYGNSAARFSRSPLAPRKLIERWFKPEPPLVLGLIIEKNAALKLGEAALASPKNLATAARPKSMPATLRPA